MNAITQLFWQICLQRTGPDAVPVSSVLLMFTGLIYGGLNLFVWVWTGPATILQASATLAMVTGGWFLVLWGIMALMGKKGRYLQTLTALLGVNVILVLLSVPLRFAADSLGETSALRMPLGFMLIGLFVWGVFIEGFIYHRALDISPLQGNLMALAMSMGIMAMLGN
ncbi:hypothetical protein A9Q81_10230 [Gammaproteobacteria bacterium 42_54_T18]|nr:hypothetical protein A9Q81_10230 [Gammaproteobacteria bacterium 42_54_T18]